MGMRIIPEFWKKAHIFISSVYYCCCCCYVVVKLCPTLCDPRDCNPPGSSVHVIFQTRIVEGNAISFSRGSSWPRDLTSLALAIRFFTTGPPLYAISSVQSLNRVWLFAIPWITTRQASLSITSSRSLPKLMFIESVMPSSHLILRHPLPLLPSIFPSIRVFSNESTLCMRWPKYCIL